MDLNHHVAIARQRQLLSDAARLRTERRPLLAAARAAVERRRAAGTAGTRPVPCPTC